MDDKENLSILMRLDERTKVMQEQIALLQQMSQQWVRHDELKAVRHDFAEKMEAQNNMINEKIRPLTWMFYATMGGLLANTISVVYTVFLGK